MATNRSRHGRAPELVDPGTSPNATKASNMYDFGIVAFEVRIDTFAWYRSVCSLETDYYGESSISQEETECSILLNGEGGSALTAGSPRNPGAAVGYYRKVLAERTLGAHVGQRGA